MEFSGRKMGFKGVQWKIGQLVIMFVYAISYPNASGRSFPGSEACPPRTSMAASFWEGPAFSQIREI